MAEFSEVGESYVRTETIAFRSLLFLLHRLDIGDFFLILYHLYERETFRQKFPVVI